MIFKVILITFVLGFVNCVQAEFNLTIIHIADFHSHWFEFDENKHDCSKQESEEGKCFGGFPRLLTFVRDIKRKEKNVIVLSSGEFFLGRTLHALHGWKMAHSLLPRLELDAMSLSNHDFDSGVLELSAFLYAMKFPVLCANMWAKNSSFLYSRVNKSHVIDVDGKKVGIVGYIHRHALKKTKSVVSVKFLPEIPALQEEVQRLESEGVDKIIALGHAGYYTDLEIARKVKGVDIVIGGDSDIMLFNPGPDSNESSKIGNIHGNYPRIHQHEPEVENDAILANRTLVLHIPQHGMYVGVLRATFDDKGKIIYESGEPVLLDSSIPQDEETLEFMKYAKAALEVHSEHSRLPHESEILGRTTRHLDGNPRNCRMRECSFGNFIADAMLHEFTFHYRNNSEHRNRYEHWGPIDAVILNSGPIKRSIEPGDIKIKDILKAINLGGFIKRVYMSGKQLTDMMEHAVKHYDPMGITPPGAFLQVAGIKVEYDLRQLPGIRVKSLQIRCRDCNDDGRYLPVKLYKTYVIGMPHFLATGRDGFYDFEEPDDEDFGQFDALLIVEYLKRMFHIEPILDGRIKFYQPENMDLNMILGVPPLLFGEPLSAVHDHPELHSGPINQKVSTASSGDSKSAMRDESANMPDSNNYGNEVDLGIHVAEQKDSLDGLHTSSEIESELKAENGILQDTVQRAVEVVEINAKENTSSLQNGTKVGTQSAAGKSNYSILPGINEESNNSHTSSDLPSDTKSKNVSIVEEFLKFFETPTAGAEYFPSSLEKLSYLIPNVFETFLVPKNVSEVKKLLKKRSVLKFLENDGNETNHVGFEDYIPILEILFRDVVKGNISDANLTVMTSGVEEFLKNFSNSSAGNFSSSLEMLSNLIANIFETFILPNSTSDLKTMLKKRTVSVFHDKINFDGVQDYVPFMEKFLQSVFKDTIPEVNSTNIGSIATKILENIISNVNATAEAKNANDEVAKSLLSAGVSETAMQFGKRILGADTLQKLLSELKDFSEKSNVSIPGVPPL